MSCKWEAKYCDGYICKRFPPSNLPEGPWILSNGDVDDLPDEVLMGPESIIMLPSGGTIYRASSFPRIDPVEDCPCGEYREAK